MWAVVVVHTLIYCGTINMVIDKIHIIYSILWINYS